MTGAAERVLDGKAVVITGSGNGIGAAYARLAAQHGAHVIVNDVNPAAAHAVAADIIRQGGRAAVSIADISSWDGAAELIDFAVATCGRLDGLVNNAAIFHMSPAAEETEEDLRAIVQVNVLGTLFCGTHAMRQMQRQKSGSIINITSGAQAGITQQAAYGATKGAVAALTYSWAIDLAPYGIRTNAVSPMAKSNMSATVHAYFTGRGETPWPELAIAPEQNAPLVIYLLSDRATGINGQVVRMDGNRLSLMTHPAVLHPPVEQEAWSVADIDAVFERDLKARQLPLGVVALEAQVRPYGLVY